MQVRTVIGLFVAVMTALVAQPALADDATTTLMLGGRFCEFYPREITNALTGVKGVKVVDLQKLKGHAVVTHDGTVKPEALVAAMKTVKGTRMGMEWFCTAEAMK